MSEPCPGVPLDRVPCEPDEQFEVHLGVALRCPACGVLATYWVVTKLRMMHPAERAELTPA